jgi:hypothetical protein
VEQFGTDFQGFAGFTTSPTVGTEAWSLTTDSVHYAFEDANTYYASLLKSYTLDRSDGSSYTFEGVVDLTDGYGDDNNRIGIYLFSPTETQTGDNGGGLYLRLNADDGKTVDIMDGGVNGTSLASASPGVTPGDLWIGQTLTFRADLVFTNISGTDKIDITFTLTDGNVPANTYTLAAQVNAANYQGTYFGFSTRWRNRGDGGSRNTPPDFDYRSFAFTDNNVSELEGYDLWASDWNTDIGSATNDFDSDGVNNLYEYGLGGSPTNSQDHGMMPVFSKSGKGFIYVHPKRSDDTNIIYTIESTTNLVSGTWTTESFAVTGTNRTGGTLNFVTNEVDAVDFEKFIRLKIGQ